jgi:threonine dehydratase
VALAALLHGLAPPAKAATAVVVSGSNVDPELYASILSAR